ncbi:mitochondrial D-lactate dehydrogenase 2 [Drechslerella stenobrocha 248]|uniref:D-2-hydroxyglutarate dehydrogenase, mitochondrial n=1 Tax=Drechslerella stenobrocha 248 TaxID=1043628 RepID=W7HPD6_9PEZI|nr:mitochondrial D-lactate dehydrogenase 2 [Drechslerella stenobrocha 248]
MQRLGRPLLNQASRGFATQSPRYYAASKEVKFTAENYPNAKRDSRFAQLTLDDVNHFKSILSSPSSVLYGQDDTSELQGFNTDWVRKYRGQSQLVLKPKTVEQVSEIMKHCSERNLAVVPQGGNTGLVGGSVPVFDEIVISLSAMNKIRSFDEVSGALVCDAGVILESADSYLRERNHIFPLDLGAKGSCHVGGNVATNAGGLRLLRYGSLHGTVLGIEAVLPDGTILHDLQTLRKNNTGFDLKQVFIGSEGTIGIITGISILCPRRSNAVHTAYFGLQSFDNVKKAFIKAKKDLGEILSAFELMDGLTQDTYHTATGKPYPLAERYPFHILIETSGSNAEHDMAKLEAFLEQVMGEEIVADGTLAQDKTQADELWKWREGLPEACAHWGGTYKYDVSIPLDEFYTLVEDTKKRLEDAGVVGGTTDESKPVVGVVGWGHMGDSNLHLNVPVRRYDKGVEGLLEPWVYEWIQKRKGSISAEHGLGFAKRDYVHYSRDPTSLELMRRVKKTFDPQGIMNP